METATIRFSMANVITITLCGALGCVMFIGLTKAWTTVQAAKSGG